MKLISSGSLLISSPQDYKNNVINTVQKQGIQITEIGVFTKNTRQININGNLIPIDSSPVDELWNISSKEF